jgi:hypothetical protein
MSPTSSNNLCTNDEQEFIQVRTNEIKALMSRTTQDIIDIGEKLIEVKYFLGHGKFTDWLKSEFSWSVSTATKFIQVAQQFKHVNFTNLNISTSALYVIAAPSTSKRVREEVLKLATEGQIISYSKAKEILNQQKSISQTEPNHTSNLQNIDFSVKNKNNEEYDCTESQKSSSASLPDETNLVKSKITRDHQLSPIVKVQSTISHKVKILVDGIILNFFSYKMVDLVTSEVANFIKELTPDQLALAVVKSTEIGLSSEHLEAIATVSKETLID